MISRKFKSCLITGVSGSGGSYLAEFLLDKKIKIFGSYRKKSRNLKKIKNRIRLIKCDLNNLNQTISLLKKTKPDVIFHLASNADVKLSFVKPREIILNNNNCTLNLLEAVRTSKINPLIQICSTSEVYGDVEKKHSPIEEKQPIQPINPYAVSKSFQDMLAQVYFKNYNLKIIITRMFTYINPRRFNLFASNWALQVAKIERGQQKVLNHGNLNSTRTVLNIKDAMNAYWLAAKKGKIGSIYNIGGKETIKLSKFLEILKSKSKVKFKSQVDQNLLRKKDILFQIPSSQKFIRETGWIPTVSLSRSIDSLLQDCRNFLIKKKT